MDFKNAFNSIRRDKVLEAVHDKAPDIYPFVHLAYEKPSHLFYEKSNIILAQEGVQPGDPLGPLLFCLSVHFIMERLPTHLFKVFYLDDVTVGEVFMMSYRLYIQLNTLLPRLVWFLTVLNRNSSVSLSLLKTKSPYSCLILKSTISTTLTFWAPL